MLNFAFPASSFYSACLILHCAWKTHQVDDLLKIQPKSNIDWLRLVEDRSADSIMWDLSNSWRIICCVLSYKDKDLPVVYVVSFYHRVQQNLFIRPSKTPWVIGQQIIFSFDYNADDIFIYSGNMVQSWKLLQLILYSFWKTQIIL